MEHKTDEQGTQPFLLCGAPGVGKTTIVQSVVHSFSKEMGRSDFSLVLYLDTSHHSCKITNRDMFWKQVYDSIASLCPKTTGEYGVEIIKTVIQMDMDNVLFVLDWNVQMLDDSVCDFKQATWVITYQGTPESSSYFHHLKVLPLNETQVDQILQSISHECDDIEHMRKLYEDCQYKGLLKSPDMVKLFHEHGHNVPCNKMLRYFIDQKVADIETKERELLGLGEIAFKMIKKNVKYYEDGDLRNVGAKTKSLFLQYHHKKGATFKLGIIEDFLAADYVVSQPDKACREWLSQVPLFKRVFRFACAFWCESVHISDEVLHKMEEYLKKLLEIGDPSVKAQKVKKKKTKFDGSKNQRSKKEDQQKKMDIDDSDERMEVSLTSNVDNTDEMFWAKNQFTKWSFLLSLTDDCQYHPQLMALLARLVSCKQSWLFKCKHLDENKVEKIEMILNHMELTRPLTIKLESGSNAKVLCKLWRLLSDFKGLQKVVSVQFMILGKGTVSYASERRLKSLSSLIAENNDNPLYITKYVGPLVCSDTPQFFKCMCMRRLEVLDVCVYDVKTLHEVLSCSGLSSLKDVILRIDLKTTEQIVTSMPRMEIPSPEAVPLTMTINYFVSLQGLLSKFESPHHLVYLSIHSVFIHENFKLDLSRFTELECVFLRLIPEVGSSSVHRTLPVLDQGDMEIDSNSHQRAQVLPMEAWTLNLAVNLVLPEGLERLLFRDMLFCNNNNSFLLINDWKGCNIQRLILLDTMLSIAGVRNILKNHVPHLANDDMEHAMKRQCTLDHHVSSEMNELVAKNPRLDREEREERRRKKSQGKELIITSNLGLCGNCKKFPCSCQQVSGGDTRETLEDLIYLIEDTYRYDILSFSFSNKIITVRKDLCGDLRVHCALTSLSDEDMLDLTKKDVWLPRLFHTLTLAQCICLEQTDLSHRGAIEVAKLLKNLKKSGLGCAEQFSLTVTSTYHPKSDDEVLNSIFLSFLKNEECLVQLNFWCCCDARCHRIKRARGGQIFMNDKKIYEPQPDRNASVKDVRCR